MVELLTKFLAWIAGLPALGNPVVVGILTAVGSLKLAGPILSSTIQRIVDITPTDADNKAWNKIKKALQHPIVKGIFKVIAWLSSINVKKKEQPEKK